MNSTAKIKPSQIKQSSRTRLWPPMGFSTRFAAFAVLFLSANLNFATADELLVNREKQVKLLQEILQDTTLVGHFTADGKAMTDLTEERYEIKKVEPIEGEPNLWTIEARIQYKKNDVTLPLVLRVEWADKTPVIVMDRVLVPGLGSFSARVVFDDGKYAGTWAHDGDGRSVGGHLFGRIEKSKKP
jgi:hypothetical protein